MFRYPPLFALAVFTVFGQSGCAIWMPPVAQVQVQRDESQEVPLLPVTPGLMAMVPGDVGKIEVGQYAKIWTHDSIESTGGSAEQPIVAGRVLAKNDDEIVLGECVGFERPISKVRQPLLQKVPYYGRLFKMTGVGVMPTPISGEVRLVKSSVLGACPIPDAEWKSFLERPQFERIGVDFDFKNER